MRLSLVSFSAFTSLVIAQTQYLTALLQLNPDLSSFADALRIVSSFAGTLNGINGNLTILAPTNQAFEALLAGGSNVASQAIKDRNRAAVEALIAYHVINGTYTSTDFMDAPKYVNTIFDQSKSPFSTNVGGGQKVGLVKQGGNATFLSGELQSSNVVQADMHTIPNITVHKIDRFLTAPLNLSATLARLPQLNTSGALGALSAINLVGSSNSPNLDTLKGITVFIPNNAAFLSIASLFQNSSTETLRNVLGYHAIQGSVVFSDTITNTTVKTVQGSDLSLSVGNNGTIYVDNARVIVPNILLSNGVAHMIDGVLNPDAADINRSSLSPTATLAPAFHGASAIGTSVPFATATSATRSASITGSSPQSTAGAGRVGAGFGAAVGVGLVMVL